MRSVTSPTRRVCSKVVEICSVGVSPVIVPSGYGVVAPQAEVSPESKPSAKTTVITGAALKSP